jgi:hypothetical protein
MGGVGIEIGTSRIDGAIRRCHRFVAAPVISDFLIPMKES